MSKRLDKYFFTYLDEYVFLELMPEYVKREHLDFMRNVPMPVKKEQVETLVEDQGIEFKHFTLGMINIIGINPSFQFAPQYINFLNYVNKDIVKAIVLVGIEQAKKGDLERACISFRAALEIAPDDQDALFNYMLVCRNIYDGSDDIDRIKDFKEEVFEILLKLEALAPYIDMVHYYLGFAYLNAGKYSEAHLQWERFMELSKLEAERNEIEKRLNELREPVLIEQGYTEIINGNHDEGLAILEKYIDTEHMKWWPLPYYLGMAYNRTGRFEDALAVLKKAFHGNPSSGEILAELVIANQALGDEVNTEKYRKKLDIIRKSSGYGK